MSKPLVVTIPHNLGRDEAARRIQDGVRGARDKYGALVTISTSDWTGGQITFQVGALGQQAQGAIAVTDTDATVSVLLPWILSRFAEKAQAIVEQQGQLLLTKK